MASLISFKQWTRQQIDDVFGLTWLRECEMLERWLNFQAPINDTEKRELHRLQRKLRDNVDYWNEQELIIKFITFIMELVDFDTSTFKSFANRKLRGKIGEHELSGEVDFLIASGKYEPRQPYFCLSEYKKEEGSSQDPLGQLLITMMTARALNEGKHPIYGAFVSGRNWFFLVLQERNYCISEEYVATKDDIFEILKILKALKQIISDLAKR